MKRLTFLFALFLCLCVFAGASEAETTWETEAEEGDLILPPLADIGFPDAPDADKPRVIKADEFEPPDAGALVTNEKPVEINPQDVAQEKEQAAQALYKLGLFRGVSTASDGTPVFDLDSVPTRNQAVIMLVRLLGKEQEALSGKWEIPFKDVQANSATAPYIGYAYANGLTKGTTATTYSGTNPVTRNQYLLFLMRAMGYAYHSFYDNGYDTSMSTSDAEFVAGKLGLLDGADAGRFTRGDVALISKRALDAYMCFNKPDLQTLREALHLGASPKFPDKFKTFSVDASYLQYADMAEIEKEYFGTYTVKEEISVPGGKIIYLVLGGGPHGTIRKLIHACDDGKVYNLPLPDLNAWGMSPEPQEFSYDAETGKLTYQAEIPQDLGWWPSATLRLAGIYQYAYRPAERAGMISIANQKTNDNYLSTAACMDEYFKLGYVTATAHKIVYSEVMAWEDVVNHADLFPLGNVPKAPKGSEKQMIRLIVADITGSLGGLPHGSSIQNPRMTLIFDALTGKLLSDYYQKPQNAAEGEYLSTAECMDEYFKLGYAASTDYNVIYSEVIDREEVANHADLFPSGDVPVGSWNGKVRLVVAEVTTKLGGKQRATLIFNALTGKVFSYVYQSA